MKPRQLKVKGRKSKMDVEVNIEKIKRNAQMDTWYEKRRIKKGATMVHDKVKVQSSWTQGPLPDFQTRERDELHVQQMYFYLAENGVVNPNIVLMMLVPEGHEYLKGHVDFDLNDDEPPFPLYAIIGDHTCTAIRKLANKFPNIEQFRTILTKLIICEKSEETIMEATYMGTLDNTLHSIHKKMSQWDCVKQMHSMHCYISNTYPKNEFSSIWKRYRNDCENSMPFHGGTFNTFTSVCCHKGNTWNYIAAIFEGRVKQNRAIKQPTPSAMTHFQQMSGVPPAKIESWLKRCVDGESNVATFHKSCILYKKQCRVKELIIDYVTADTGEDYETWSEVVEEFPKMGQKNWFEQIMGLAPAKAKEGLNAYTKKFLDDCMQECREMKDRASSVQVN